MEYFDIKEEVWDENHYINVPNIKNEPLDSSVNFDSMCPIISNQAANNEVPEYRGNNAALKEKKISKKLTELNVKQKMELLNYVSTHSERETALKFSVSKTTVNNIKKRKTEITQRFKEESPHQHRKRRNTELDEVNKRTLFWFQKMQSVNERVSGPMLQDVAKKIAEQLNFQQFKASNGWLESFKKRNCKIHKVSSDADEGVERNFLDVILEFCQDYALSNVFNADGCCLFFKATPDRTIAIKGDTCKRGNMSKERLTLLLAASATGEKLKPLVIGKTKLPRCFKNIQVEKLPVLWRANKRAWMTIDLFNEWLHIVNAQMMKENRKILLLIDNCPVNSKLAHFSNIKLQFLPPNCTSLLQPLDQGIIRKFKFFYRNFLLSTVVANADNEKSAADIASTINVLDSIYWISQAWDKVRTETITNCFRKAGFTPATIFKEEPEETVFENYDINSFVTCDDQVTCWETFNADEVLESVLNENSNKEIKTTDNDLDYEEDDLLPLSELSDALTIRQASTMLDKIWKFATNNLPDILEPLSIAKRKISQEILKNHHNGNQKTLDKYFYKT